MYQGICIANCESYATHPQRNLYRTLYWSEVSLPSGYYHQCHHERGQNYSCIFNSADCQYEETWEKKPDPYYRAKIVRNLSALNSLTA